MAKQADNAATEDGQEKPAKSRKKLFILVGIGLLALLLSAGGVAYFLLSGEEDEAATDVPAEPVKQVALYQALEPPFVVNYTDGGRQRYLQVSVVLMGRSPEGMAKLNQHLPLIRNQLVMLFGSEEFGALMSPEGKDALREKAGLAVKALLEKEVGDPVIDSVLFTNMVLQ